MILVRYYSDNPWAWGLKQWLSIAFPNFSHITELHSNPVKKHHLFTFYDKFLPIVLSLFSIPIPLWYFRMGVRMWNQLYFVRQMLKSKTGQHFLVFLKNSEAWYLIVHREQGEVLFKLKINKVGLGRDKNP